MRKFNIGDKVKMFRKTVEDWGDLESVRDYYKDFPYGYVTGYTDGYVCVDNNPFSRTGNFFMESDIKLVSHAKKAMKYTLQYTDSYGDLRSEDFGKKEEVLEYVQYNSLDIDFDEPVEVFEVVKSFQLEKTEQYTLVEA